MTIGLPVSRLINVQVTLDPLAAQYANFGTLLLMGESDVISASERIRLYNNIEGVTEDFGTITPEFLAAERFFSQVPQPNVLLIGRWQSGYRYISGKGLPVLFFAASRQLFYTPGSLPRHALMALLRGSLRQ